MTGSIDDVVDEDEIFAVSMKVQSKMQGRHNLMLNIQNISKIINDLELGINRYAMILNSLETNKDVPFTRIIGDFIVPVVSKEDAIAELELGMERFDAELKKHIEQVKSMQLQHDGLSKEIDVLMELEKGKFEAGKKQREDKRERLKRKGRRK